MSKTIAVTGGTGFIGGAVIRAAINAGWAVHSYGRREVPGTVFHHWDATDRHPSVRGQYDAVIHCAASATHWGSEFDIIRTNLWGTRKALEIDPHARFIHLSTASVYGSNNKRSGHRSIEDEQLPMHDFLNVYARSKAYAEDVVLKDTRNEGTVILRPHAVYGPGDTTLLPRLEKSIRRGKLVLPGGGWNVASLTRIENLVQVILDMVGVKSPDHRVYNVADGGLVTMRTALELILRKRGKQVSVIDLPSPIAWKLGAAAEWLYKEMDLAKAPPITRYLVSQLGYEQTLDLTRIQNQLGRKLPFSDFSDAGAWDKEQKAPVPATLSLTSINHGKASDHESLSTGTAPR